MAAPQPTTPAAQIGQVLVGMGSVGGTQRVTVQLSPTELGRVQISIERSADGTSVINVTAERPETLALVKADAAQLHAALDQAGIGPQGRALHFHLADPTDATAAATPPVAQAAIVHQPAVAASTPPTPVPFAPSPTTDTAPQFGNSLSGGQWGASQSGFQQSGSNPSHAGRFINAGEDRVSLLDFGLPAPPALSAARGIDITA